MLRQIAYEANYFVTESYELSKFDVNQIWNDEGIRRVQAAASRSVGRGYKNEQVLERFWCQNLPSSVSAVVNVVYSLRFSCLKSPLAEWALFPSASTFQTQQKGKMRESELLSPSFFILVVELSLMTVANVFHCMVVGMPAFYNFF